jgi:hypothetical protein
VSRRGRREAASGEGNQQGSLAAAALELDPVAHHPRQQVPAQAAAIFPVGMTTCRVVDLRFLGS